MKSCKTVYSKGRKRKAWKKAVRKKFQMLRREHICLKQINDLIITRVNGWNNKKIPDFTFFYGATPSSTVLDIKSNTTI